MIRNSLIRAFLVLAISALFVFAASAATDATVSANGGLRLRAGASTNHSVMMLIPNGATVSVTERGESWCKVTYSGKTGYVMTRYLNIGTTATSRGDANRDTLSAKRQAVVNAAVAQLGKPYRYGANGPNSFDCAGFTQYVYKICGYSIARGASSQLRGSSVSVAKSDLLPGDLVFFKDSRYGSGAASHVGLYVGNGQMIHSPNSGQVVKYASINSGYYARTYIGARRYIN